MKSLIAYHSKNSIITSRFVEECRANQEFYQVSHKECLKFAIPQISVNHDICPFIVSFLF